MITSLNYSSFKAKNVTFNHIKHFVSDDCVAFPLIDMQCSLLNVFEVQNWQTFNCLFAVSTIHLAK